jgi:hypothetical protein
VRGLFCKIEGGGGVLVLMGWLKKSLFVTGRRGTGRMGLFVCAAKGGKESTVSFRKGAGPHKVNRTGRSPL